MMDKYINVVLDAYYGYFDYLKNEILYPSWTNYFWWLLGLSAAVWLLEVVFPWREKQAIFRKDFWLDGFYMFFNFFLFSLIAYNAISNIAVEAFNDFLGVFGLENIVALHVETWPVWAQFLLLFVLADFIQWNVHRALHRYPALWEFHKVHHSVEEMGFAAHLRFHWMETIIYKTVQYIPLAMIGFGLVDFFIVHIFTTAIGHLNHANLRITYGPLKYIVNNPIMHIWHHAKKLPEGVNGVNYGLTLSVWDYLFGTAYIPNEGKDEPLGFDGMETFPKSFWSQVTYPFIQKKK
ncbi:Sterol desaturase/sphingolipid hydroxylase, fatty acid hydroxylase superfamily [Belliella pelovolcani]|uniref:Sterol desaturase/sphingolipid hydroxylase, fatty acid hydroxylase superfamily n=2 Tax=Belliella pelovolcani TaxID=529505 RepID=A0A1N7LBN5_9BACT|nr:Sterol desaturase/sphingolipid hydroxylase, fatty acid hydroxylase superfamily [Belliella pelovolcani]